MIQTVHIHIMSANIECCSAEVFYVTLYVFISVQPGIMFCLLLRNLDLTGNGWCNFNVLNTLCFYSGFKRAVVNIQLVPEVIQCAVYLKLYFHVEKRKTRRIWICLIMVDFNQCFVWRNRVVIKINLTQKLLLGNLNPDDILNINDCVLIVNLQMLYCRSCLLIDVKTRTWNIWCQ